MMSVKEASIRSGLNCKYGSIRDKNLNRNREN